MVGLVQRLRSANLFDRKRCAQLADGLVIALAISLPWSTSAASIFAALWLVAIVPTLDAPSLHRVLGMPAGGLPVLLFALAIVGTLWAEIPLAERWDGVKPFLKLLFIPLLIFHFSRSTRGSWVMVGFFISCSVLLLVSWILVLRWFLTPELRMFPVQLFGMPTRDYIAQSGEFTLCIFLLAKLVLDDWRARRHRRMIAYLLLAAAFLANILYVSTSRTMLVIIPVLLFIFAWHQLPRKGMIALLLAGAVGGALAWPLAPLVRANLTDLFSEVKDYRPEGPASRAGFRLEFWRKSIEFIADAPVIGHGTGSGPEVFRRAAVGQTGVAASIATNPHNQTFAVAIQLGLLGTSVLFALWLAHLMQFRGESLLAWAGLLIVTQNIVGSLFNSHLFDFSQGWAYVIGVGVAGGMVLKTASAPRP
jgi:O-antigen ligase